MLWTLKRLDQRFANTYTNRQSLYKQPICSTRQIWAEWTKKNKRERRAGGKGEGETDTDRFKRMQKTEGRQRAQVTVFWRSTDFRVWSVVSSYSIGVKNQNERPEKEHNSSLLNVKFVFKLWADVVDNCCTQAWLNVELVRFFLPFTSPGGEQDQL